MRRAIDYVAHHTIGIGGLVCLLLVGLAGGSYAAFTAGGGTVRVWARVRPDGHLIAGAGGPKVVEQITGVYVIDWRSPVSGRCATNATVDAGTSRPTESVSTPQLSASFVAGYASAGTSTHRRVRRTLVETFNQNGQATSLGFDVVVVC